MTKQKQNKTTRVKVARKGNTKLSTAQRIGFGVGALVIALGAIMVMSLYARHRSAAELVDTRLARIEAIYDSLSIDSSTRFVSSNVFGDKRPYEVGEGRTYSSYITYAHPETVPDTMSLFDGKITAAGFTFIDEPYPGSLGNMQYHYKSANGEYIRLSVSSKLYDDAYQNAIIMGESDPSEKLSGLDRTAAPSYVTIKVNLDDNNE